jgi:hypothetical protein
VGAGRSLPVIKSARDVTSQLSGSLCTVRQCTAGLAQGCHWSSIPEGSPEFIPSTSRLSP